MRENRMIRVSLLLALVMCLTLPMVEARSARDRATVERPVTTLNLVDLLQDRSARYRFYMAVLSAPGEGMTGLGLSDDPDPVGGKTVPTATAREQDENGGTQVEPGERPLGQESLTYPTTSSDE